MTAVINDTNGRAGRGGAVMCAGLAFHFSSLKSHESADKSARLELLPEWIN